MRHRPLWPLHVHAPLAPPCARSVSHLPPAGPHTRSHSVCPEPGRFHSAPCPWGPCVLSVCHSRLPSSGCSHSAAWLDRICWSVFAGPSPGHGHGVRPPQGRPLSPWAQPLASAALWTRELGGQEQRPWVPSRCPAGGPASRTPRDSWMRPAVCPACRQESTAGDAGGLILSRSWQVWSPDSRVSLGT